MDVPAFAVYSGKKPKKIRNGASFDRKKDLIGKLKAKKVSKKNEKKKKANHPVEHHQNGHQSPKTSVADTNGSVEEGLKRFEWLISPVESKTFFKKFWEKTHCLIQRNGANYFKDLISFRTIDDMLFNNHIEFTKNIDVTSYKNGVRETLNPEGRALPPIVWEFYASGCSIRLLNPQTYIPQMFALNTTLQEYFHCMVGANVYLTPPNSQGFAPHYDDIEAFVLQVEGKKRWKLYKPRSDDEVLPRFSSENFKEEDLGKPVLDVVLNPGDVLYFPRGMIHQACTAPGYHSLHITLSVYQKQSYADLFEKLLPAMLSRAIAENVELRRGLPLNLWRNFGIVHSDEESKERTAFKDNCHRLLLDCMKNLPLDEAVDQLAKNFQHDALPPEITASEHKRTVFGSKNALNAKGEVCTEFELQPSSRVRLLRANIIRLVEEEGKINMYYYGDNSREYHEYEANFMEIDPDDAQGVEALIKTYPTYVRIKDLPLDEGDDERKLSLVQCLWERGLIMIEKEFS